MSTRVLLVDDHEIMRDGLRLLLTREADVEVVGGAADSETAWSAIVELQPALVVMDLDLPGEGGIALIRRMGAEYPETKAVVLSGHIEPEFVNAALRAGASGYIYKGNAGADLLTAIRTVLLGKVYLCPECTTVVVREYQHYLGTKGGGALSAREVEVLKGIADGQTTKEIAFALHVSPKTIETQRLNLMEKLGITSVAGLTKYAIREGLTTL